MSVAVIAAAIANPVVEFASNAGWFGTRSFTDHSNIDVLPTLIAGVGLLALYLIRKSRAILAEERCSETLVALLPSIFAFEFATLYVMETSEQLLVWRHVLGPMVWLGAPLPIGAAIHAAICCAVAFALIRSKRSLASTTLRVVRLIQAIATLRIASNNRAAVRAVAPLCFKERLPVLGSLGERAPPAAI